MSEKQLQVRFIGRIGYEEAWDLQQEVWQQRVKDQIPDTLLLLEHDPVFTMGSRETSHNLLVNPEYLRAPVVKTNRGGEMTYHGPGQLVGYFHCKLPELTAAPLCRMSRSNYDESKRYSVGVKDFVFAIEEVFIRYLAQYNLSAWRDLEHRGVWLGEPQEPSYTWRKLVAVGISIKNNVSLHGFAFNISTDLSYFQQIIPCGIAGRGVSSLAAELQKLGKSSLPDIEKSWRSIAQIFSEVFSYKEFHLWDKT